MSDTHDRLDAVETAIDFFNRKGVADVLHAGDLVSAFVALKLSKVKAKLHYVWGNNEGDREFITVRFGEIGVVPVGDFAALELDGRRITLFHGRHQRIVGSPVASGLYDVVVQGYTHEPEIVDGKTLLASSGELCGYLSCRRTVALIHLDKMHAEIVEL